MSLTTAIKFRHLISQLTDGECVAFLSKLIDSHRDTIVTSLFHYFAKPNQINQVDTANEIYESLSDIIQSRKEKPKAISAKDIKLHQLPRAIIGYTASFLTQLNYCDFSMSSRSIYLGCNSPNLLHELQLDDEVDYSCFNLALFASIKSLSIDPSYLNHLDSPILNQITTLTLCPDGATEWVQEFVGKNIVNYNTVTKLNCDYFGWDQGSHTERTDFLNLLTRFPNIKHLKLVGFWGTHSITAQDIANACPDVVELQISDGIHTYNGPFNVSLITLLASKLKCLSFKQRDLDDVDESVFATVTFDELEELKLSTEGKKYTHSLHAILKSASNLKKILIKADTYTSNIDMQKAMETIVLKCPRLTYLRLVITPSHLSSVLEGIEYGLFKTKKQHRSELKINIIIRYWNSDEKANTFTLNVGRIVYLLESSAINDFMFIWDLDNDVGDDELNEIFDDLCTISAHTKVLQHKGTYLRTLTIANRHCKINGYRDVICGEYPEDK